MKTIIAYVSRVLFGKLFPLLFIFAFLPTNYIHAQSSNLDLVISAIDRQDYNTALNGLNKEITENPSNAFAYYYRSWVYFNQYDDLTNSLRDVNTALDKFKRKEKKGKSKAYHLRASLYLAINEWDKAMKDFDKALKFDSKNIEIRIERADALFQHQDFSLAEKDLQLALRVDPTETSIYAGLARNYLAMEKWEDTRLVIDRWMRLSPNDINGYVYRAILSYQNKDYDKAIDDILRAYILSEEDADILNRFFKYAEKNQDLAIAMVSEMIRQRGSKGNGFFIRAGLYEKKNQFALAIKDYNAMMDMADASQISRIRGYRSACFNATGNYAQALADVNAWKESDSLNAYVYFSRSEIYRGICDMEKAMEDLNKAIALSPTEGWIYFARALLKKSVNKFNSSSILDDFSQSVSLEPSSYVMLLTRGYFYLSVLKDTTKARFDFEQVLKLDKGTTSSCRPIAHLLLGSKEAARLSMDSALKINPNKENYYCLLTLFSLREKEDDCKLVLDKAIEKGFRDFDYLKSDPLLDYFNGNENLKKYLNAVIQKYREKIPEELIAEMEIKDSSTLGSVTIPMKARGGGVYEISCKVNDLKLSFIFDTGASDISISQTEASFMLKNGYLSEQDILGTRKYLDANGMIDEGTRVLLKKVDFGGLILTNVTASVANSKTAPLLFGQSALARYARIVIDNAKNEITITTNK